MKLSEKVMTVEPSATLAITSKAKEMKRNGEDVVILAAGEPDFDTPDIIKEAAIRAIHDGQTKYTPASGTVTLKNAICNKLEIDNGLKYDPSEIVVSCGAKHSIYNLLQVICNPGDEVLIVHPYWVSYPEMVKLAGARPITVKTTEANGFRATADDIKAAVTGNTRALIINSPSNPAGVIYNEKELKEIARVCVSSGILIISDEIYEKIIFDGKTHYSIASISDEVRASTVVINGVSKTFAMTGWRIGYMAGAKEIVSMVSTLQSHSSSNPCSISQAAAECALTADLGSEILKNSQMFQERRDALMDIFLDCEKVKTFNPQGAFYLFCDISACGMDSFTFARELLEEQKVAVIPGSPFGDDRYIRISFAADIKTIKDGAERIKEWVKK